MIENKYTFDLAGCVCFIVFWNQLLQLNLEYIIFRTYLEISPVKIYAAS